ncbi:MAG TPA: glycosyltransferase family 4 protein [Chloroflexota bacterium]|nr:glycosyltransferase family 4 protein [Chloroflexota bacterium]
MKVLMYSWEYPPNSVGGLGKHVVELIPALGRQGIEVHLATPRRAGGEEREEICPVAGGGASIVYRVDAAEPPGDFFALAQGVNGPLEAFGRELWASAGPFELVHVHDWLVSFAGVALKHAFRTPLLATIHATEYGRCRGNIQSPMSRAINGTEWWLTYEAWRAICCSRFMAAEIQTALGAPPDKLDVIANGVETARFDALDGEDLTSFRARFAAPDEPIVFYVGRVVYEKGVHLLVQAMPLLLQQNPGIRLIVAGRGDSLAYARQLSEELGVADQCIFTGFISDEDRDRLFRVADVAAFPSLYEPFGIVALEAMAARTPVVCADVGGLSEVVQHEETAITVYSNNVGSLAWGIQRVLDDPAAARRRADVAYRMVVDQYNWDAIARQTADVYERVVDERTRVSWP